MLIEADGEIVTREEIRQRLWPDDTVVEFDHSINNAIKKLRRALVDSDDDPHYIGTIAKRGYRLLVPVERTRTEDLEGRLLSGSLRTRIDHARTDGCILCPIRNQAPLHERGAANSPAQEGNWWWIQPWTDTWADGQIRRKRQRIKVAPADTGAREAQRIAAEIMRGQNQGLESIGSVTPFRVFVESDYRKAVLPLLAAPVQKNYNIVLRTRLLPEFGDLPLRELNKRRLQAYFSNLKGGRATAAKVRDVLASVLNAAVRFELLTKSPLEGVQLLPDKVGRKRKPIISKEGFPRLVDGMEEPYATMVFVCVMTSLRVSELLGLKWATSWTGH